jgi:hypothetical protein
MNAQQRRVRRRKLLKGLEQYLDDPAEFTEVLRRYSVSAMRRWFSWSEASGTRVVLRYDKHWNLHYLPNALASMFRPEMPHPLGRGGVYLDKAGAPLEVTLTAHKGDAPMRWRLALEGECFTPDAQRSYDADRAAALGRARMKLGILTQEDLSVMTLSLGTLRAMGAVDGTAEDLIQCLDDAVGTLPSPDGGTMEPAGLPELESPLLAPGESHTFAITLERPTRLQRITLTPLPGGERTPRAFLAAHPRFPDAT